MYQYKLTLTITKLKYKYYNRKLKARPHYLNVNCKKTEIEIIQSQT